MGVHRFAGAMAALMLSCAPAVAAEPLDRSWAAREIWLHVRGGFDSPADIDQLIEEGLVEPGSLTPDDRAWAAAEAAQAWAVKRADEATWPARTDWDRLVEVFTAFAADGVIGLHNAGMTQSDGAADAWQVWHERGGARSGLKGYVFYHWQDVDRVADGLDLYLTFASYVGKPEDDAAIGRIVLDRLKAAGFDAGWNGDPDQRIYVSGLVWRKRSP